MTTPQDPQALLRSKSYLRLLILTALLSFRGRAARDMPAQAAAAVAAAGSFAAI